MSSRKPTNKARARGASRPIDPRRAPGRPQRKGPDKFSIGLIVVSALVAIGLLALLAMQNRGTNTASVPSVAATVPSDPTQAASASQTQQEITFATQTAALTRISPADAKALYDAHNVKIIDVRTADLYAKQHIVGATNTPYTELKTRINEFPKTGNLIVYCQ